MAYTIPIKLRTKSGAIIQGLIDSDEQVLNMQRFLEEALAHPNGIVRINEPLQDARYRTHHLIASQIESVEHDWTDQEQLRASMEQALAAQQAQSGE
jgi:hypothetical protein